MLLTVPLRICCVLSSLEKALLRTTDSGAEVDQALQKLAKSKAQFQSTDAFSVFLTAGAPQPVLPRAACLGIYGGSAPDSAGRGLFAAQAQSRRRRAPSS